MPSSLHMKDAGYTKQERAMIALMRIWAIAFLGAGVLFAAAPDYIPNYVTDIGTVLLDWNAPQLPQEGRFWVVLAVALLFSLSYMCMVIQKNVVRNIGYTRPILLAKFTSSIGFAICYCLLGRQFIFLVAALVDGSIFLITWSFYRRALRSRA
ncbi:MAG: hypothetical protein V2A66_02445 [Pseudomonadota bacterium]